MVVVITLSGGKETEYLSSRARRLAMELWRKRLEDGAQDDDVLACARKTIENNGDDQETVTIVGLLLKFGGNNGALDEFFVSAAKNAVQRMVDGNEALDSDGRDRRLKVLLDACASCSLESSQSYAIASFLWKGANSLLERSDAAELATRALSLMCSAAEKVLLQSIRATTENGDEATAAKLLKIVRFFTAAVQKICGSASFRNLRMLARPPTDKALPQLCRVSTILHSCLCPSRKVALNLPAPMTEELASNSSLSLLQALQDNIPDHGQGSVVIDHIRSVELDDLGGQLDVQGGKAGLLIRLFWRFKREEQTVDSFEDVFRQVAKGNALATGKIQGRSKGEQYSFFDACTRVLGEVALTIVVADPGPPIFEALLRLAMGSRLHGRMLALSVIDQVFARAGKREKFAMLGFFAAVAEISVACGAERQKRILCRILARFVGRLSSDQLDELMKSSRELSLRGHRWKTLQLSLLYASRAQVLVQQHGSRFDGFAVGSHSKAKTLGNIKLPEEMGVADDLLIALSKAEPLDEIAGALKKASRICELHFLLRVLVSLDTRQLCGASRDQLLCMLSGPSSHPSLAFVSLQLLRKIASHPELVTVTDAVLAACQTASEKFSPETRITQAAHSVQLGAWMSALLELCKRARVADPALLMPRSARSRLLALVQRRRQFTDHAVSDGLAFEKRSGESRLVSKARPVLSRAAMLDIVQKTAIGVSMCWEGGKDYGRPEENLRDIVKIMANPFKM